MKTSRKLLCCILALVLALGTMAVAVYAGVDDVVVNFDYSNMNTTYSDYLNTDGNVYPAYFYDGNGHSPVISVSDGDKALIKGSDYSVTYSITNITYGGQQIWQDPPEGGIWNGRDKTNVFQVIVSGIGAYAGFDEISHFVIIERPNFKVTFYKNDGTDTSDYIWVPYGDSVNDSSSSVPSFEREGYEFEGWYKDEECSAGNKFSLDAAITDATDLYAKWIKLVTSVEVTMPDVFEGEGYAIGEGWSVVPAPEVSIPGGVNYMMDHSDWVVPKDGGYLGYDMPETAATFKKGDTVYVYTVLRTKDASLYEFIHEKTESEHEVEITVKNGEYVASGLDVNTSSTSGETTYSLCIVSKVIVQGRPSPSTGDSNPFMIVWVTIATLAVALFMTYGFRKKTARR